MVMVVVVGDSGGSGGGTGGTDGGGGVSTRFQEFNNVAREGGRDRRDEELARGAIEWKGPGERKKVKVNLLSQRRRHGANRGCIT